VSRRRLGLLALGETPRHDITPTLCALIGEGASILQRGGLDGLSPAQIEAMRARPGEPLIETRLRDGRPIGLDKARLMPRLHEAAAWLESECGIVMILCSGDFPELRQAFPRLILPLRIARGAVGAVCAGRRLGIVGPESDLAEAPAQWAPYCGSTDCEAASPYGPAQAPAQAAAALAARGCEIILLDDMGFTETHRQEAAAASGIPVLCPTSLAASVLRELL
jgi:protein AroM